jgi:hypothetical protein
MRASSISFLAAVLFVIVGMVWGLAMGISHDHSTFPAHAHLNLVGFVLLFLFGIFYHLHPVIDRSRIALLQVWVWILGTIVLTIGIGLVQGGYEAADPIAGIGSIIILLDTILFGYFVFRRDGIADPHAGNPRQPSVFDRE